MMYPIQQIRNDFPILRQKANGVPLTYLDSTNTSLTPQVVVEAMDEYYHEYNANVHRAVYQLSERATDEMEKAREKVTKFVNAASNKEIIFTRNGTESLNLVAKTWGEENLGEGDVVLLSMMEHHSNIVPWQILQQKKNFTIQFLQLTKEGRIDLEEYKNILKNENIKLVSLTHQSNVLGTINPIKELCELAHEKGALFVLDACQSVPHHPVDVQDLGIDFMAVSGHKMLGPTGIGFLYGKEALLKNIPPFLGGGDMIKTVSCESSTWNDLPFKFEAGTPNISGAIGLGAAVDYLHHLGMPTIEKYEQQLGQYTLEKLQKIKGLKILGPPSMDNRGAIFSFTLEGLHPHDLASLLAERNICIRAGHHCAQPLMESFKIPASSRVSLSLYNSEEDILRLVEGIERAKKIFQV